MIPTAGPYIGEICALLAPLCWAAAVIGFRKSDLPAGSTNLFKNAVALILLSATLIGFGIPIPADRSAADWLWLAGSSVVGLVIADLAMLEGLRRLGAARTALVDTTYAPTMVLLAWALLGERPTAGFALGALAVVVGVAVASVDLQKAVGAGDRRLAVGALLAFVGILGTGSSVLLIKPILERSNLIEVTWFRLVVGLAAQGLWVAARNDWASALVAFRPSPQWRSLVPATIMGTYFALILWLGGFKWADASVAAVLNQMATVYILVLARLVLAESVSLGKAIGAMIAVFGAIVVVVAG